MREKTWPARLYRLDRSGSRQAPTSHLPGELRSPTLASGQYFNKSLQFDVSRKRRKAGRTPDFAVLQPLSLPPRSPILRALMELKHANVISIYFLACVSRKLDT